MFFSWYDKHIRKNSLLKFYRSVLKKYFIQMIMKKRQLWFDKFHFLTWVQLEILILNFNFPSLMRRNIDLNFSFQFIVVLFDKNKYATFLLSWLYISFENIMWISQIHGYGEIDINKSKNKIFKIKKLRMFRRLTTTSVLFSRTCVFLFIVNWYHN